MPNLSNLGSINNNNNKILKVSKYNSNRSIINKKQFGQDKLEQSKRW
jgi:hypothetical protein